VPGRKVYRSVLIALACAVVSGTIEAREHAGRSGAAVARFRPLVGVPYPRPRPREHAPAAAPAKPVPEGPSECLQRLTKDIATVHALPAIEGPGACGAVDVVRLEAVFTTDSRRVALAPPAVLRCSMAEAVVRWLREEAAPLIAQRGAPPASLTTAASFECRGRNRVVGAQLSQHGLANALDIRAFTLADGKVLGLTDAAAAKDLRLRLQETACARFTTVLGPGSDGYHEDHIHLDLAERRSGYRLCQWAVRDPAEAAALAAAAAAKAAAGKLPKFTPLVHQDGGSPGTLAPQPSALRPQRADRSGPCRAGQDCLRGSLHPPAAAPRRKATRRSGRPWVAFPW
jgi:hypothetical protein